MLHQRLLIPVLLICLTLNVSSQTNRVGIGTTSPLALLHVEAPAGDNPFRVRVNGQTKLYVDALGNIGLSTLAPQEKLHVIGNVFASSVDGDVHMQMHAANAFSSSLELFEYGDLGFEFEYDGSPDKLYLRSRGFTDNEGIRMTWLKDGKVGIGATSPQELLHVGGNILSTGNYIQVKDGNQGLSLVPNAAEGYVNLDVGGTGHSQDHIILAEADGGSLNKVGIGTSNPGSVISNALFEVNGGHIALENNYGIFSNNSFGTGIGAVQTKIQQGCAAM